MKPNDTQLAFAILSRVLADSVGQGFYARDVIDDEMEPFDHELAARLRAPGTPPSPSNRDSTALLRDTSRPQPRPDSTLPDLATFDTERLASLEATNIGFYQRAMQELETVATDWAGATATLSDLEAQWKAMPVAQRDAGGDTTALGYAATAALAARLKKPSAAGWLDLALISTERNENADVPRLIIVSKAMVCEIAALGGVELFARAAGEVTPIERARALAGAIEKLAPSDLSLSLALLEKLWVMTQSDDETTRAAGDYGYGRAAQHVLAHLKNSEAAAALEIARRVRDENSRPVTLALAARLQSESGAREQLFREAVATAREPSVYYGNGESSPAALAVLALKTDAALDEKLLRELLAQKTDEMVAANVAVNAQTSNAALAFYVARFDAGAARRLIESEYSLRVQSAQSENFFVLPTLVLAMSAIDVERALEMARALADGNARYDTQRKIAQYILADEATRRTLSFERWAVPNTWRPVARP